MASGPATPPQPAGPSHSPSDLSPSHQLSSVAIEHLPFELLVIIIKLAALVIRDCGVGNPTMIIYTDQSGYYQKLHVIAQTCRLWSRIIEESPELWWRVDTQDPRHIWMAAIKRSRSNLISIRSSSLGEPFNQEFWLAVTPHIRRCWTADINFDKNVPLDFVRALENEALALKSLEVRVTAPFSWDEPVGPSHQVSLNLLAPLLNRLLLDHVTLPNWNSHILSGLRVLQLICIDRSGPSVSQMLEVLRVCPRLHYLKLLAVTFSNVAAKHHTNVTLPQLMIIDMSDVSSVATANIIQAIQAPRCTEFSINTLDEMDDAALRTYEIVTGWITSTFRRYLTAGGHVTITSSEPITFSVSPDNPNSAALHISLGLPLPPDHPGVLQWGLGVIGCYTLPAAPLTIQADVEFFSLAQSTSWVTALKSLRNVVSLGFKWCEDDGMGVILQELTSRGTSTPDEPSCWLCPELCELQLTSSGPKHLVLSMLKACMEAARLGGSLDGTGGIAAITQLEVYEEECMDRGTFRSIRETLGNEADCFWELNDGTRYDGVNEIVWEEQERGDS